MTNQKTLREIPDFWLMVLSVRFLKFDFFSPKLSKVIWFAMEMNLLSHIFLMMVFQLYLQIISLNGELFW